jgi:hypothetical protein
MSTQFESRGEYTVKAKVERTRQRKFKVTIQGENPRQVTKDKAITMAVQAAKALTFRPDPTVADVQAAEDMTAKIGRGVPSDETQIRSGVSVGGRKVALYRGAFGRFTVKVAGLGLSKAMGREAGLHVYMMALTSKE